MKRCKKIPKRKMVLRSDWHRKLDKNTTISEESRKILHALIDLYPMLLEGRSFVMDEIGGVFTLSDAIIYYPDKTDFTKLEKALGSRNLP